MEEIKKQTRSFGILFSVIFGLLSSYLYLEKKVDFFYLALLVTLIFLFLAIFKPLSLRIFNFLWRRLGMTLGMIISPIILSLIYFFLFTLTKIFLILSGKDLLDMKKNNNNKTYWKTRSYKLNNMDEQF